MRNHSSNCLCIVYVLRNTVNNKIYIGQTWRPLHIRWRSGTGYDSCCHLDRAIKAYGKNNFYYQVLITAHTQESADYWESYFIEKYKSNDFDLGYNLRQGGSSGKHSMETRKKLSIAHKGRPSHNKGKPMSDEQKNKISLANTGKIKSAETRAKMAEINKGNKNCVGRRYSQETKDKMSKSHKERPRRKGYKFSEEAKKNVSEAHKGLKRSDEGNRKCSVAIKGRTWKLVDGKRIWSPPHNVE